MKVSLNLPLQCVMQAHYLNGHPEVVPIFYPRNQELYPHFDLEGEETKKYI